MLQRSITSLFLLILTLCTFAQDNWQATQEKLIRERINQFVNDVNQSNVDGFVDAFSDQLYSPETKSSIKASVIQRDKTFQTKYAIHINAIKVDQKMAYEEGWFRNELIPKNGGESVIQEFDFLDVWELESDGQWRIVKAMKKERLLKTYKSLADLKGEPAQIAGNYATEKFPVNIKVTDSDQLVLIVNNGAPIKLKQTSKLTYELEGIAGAKLQFELGKGGLAQKAIMKQASGAVVAIRN